MIGDNDSIVFKIHNGGEEYRSYQQINGHVISEFAFRCETLNDAEEGPYEGDLSQ